MTTYITVIGTIATDPKLIRTKSGVDLCSFRLASGDRRFDRERQQWVDGETSWYSITAFRSMAEHALKSFRKGERVVVAGRLRIREWSSGERSGTSADVEADAIGHDVRWGVSRFEKQSGAATDSPPQGEETGEEARPTAQEERPEEEFDSDGFLPAAA